MDELTGYLKNLDPSSRRISLNASLPRSGTTLLAATSANDSAAMRMILPVKYHRGFCDA
jgi:hypothetical protein